MQDYFNTLTDLLKLEKKEDEMQFAAVFEHKSISERRADGVTWFPVAIRNQEMQRGDYLSVELERTTHQHIQHQFRSGMPVFFFSNHDPRKDRIAATVTFQSKTKIRILLRTDELPEWSSDGKLGVDLAFDNQSYQEMDKALKSAPNYEKSDVYTGSKKAEFGSREYENSDLNASQQEAVRKILSANDLAIVHGPPGTGKTTTLVEAIKALSKENAGKILVTAPSNTAVDLLAEKFSLSGINVLRIGNPARVSEHLDTLILENKIANHPAAKDIRKLKIQANEYRSLAHKYKRNFGKAERDQRKALFDEAYKVLKEVEDIENYIISTVLENTQVVAATLVGSANYQLAGLQFDTVVIDEAGQALEPACWIPIQKGKKLILAGDHHQLPPTIKSQEAAKQGLEETLLEKLIKTQPESVAMLDMQYRMNEKIAEFSSQAFYNSQLKAHDSVKNWTLGKDIAPLLFLDTAGCGFDEKLEGTSLTNGDEAAFLVKRIEEIFTELPLESVGVVSPYKQHLRFLEGYIDSSEFLSKHRKNISINTIDSYQGQERDAIFISLVRSNTDGEIGFLSDIRRMNVAMTRARKLLVVVGDSATIGSHPFYEKFITHTQNTDAYKSAWEYII